MRAVLLGGLAAWGLWFATRPIQGNEVASSFLHGVNLVFHEAGHVLLAPFGAFLRVLGGSLLQVVVPATCAVALLWQARDACGAAIALWWLGQNLVDLAPYIDDARRMRLLLLGGFTGHDVPGAHDWNWLLATTHALAHDHALARAVHACGAVVMAGAIGWGAWVLRHEWRAAAPPPGGPVDTELRF